MLLPVMGSAQGTGDGAAVSETGPIELQMREPSSASSPPIRPDKSPSTGNAAERGTPAADGPEPGPRTGYRQGEFERYVQRLIGPADPAQPEVRPQVRRLGADLLETLAKGGEMAGHSPLVPNDYLVQSGDEIVVTIWGSVSADLRLQVDRSGRISIPRVGTIMVAGVRYGDLTEAISRRVGQVFRNYQISVALGQLRGMRVFLTGFVAKPGVATVSGLSTLSQALLTAGGPAASGSFRNVQLRRGRELVDTFDLYDLLLKGDRSADRVLQPDDVIHVGPVGPLVALIGSVNRPAVMEIKPGETIDDALRMAGGFTAVADTSRLTLVRLGDRRGLGNAVVSQPEFARGLLQSGDVLRALNSAEVKLSTVPQNNRVRVEGEVALPGDFVLPPGSTIADALTAAGGLTANAYLFGTEFNRESVRLTQQQNYERALRDFETELVRAPASQRAATTDEAAAQNAAAAAGTRLLEKLRAIRPTGRLVLQLEPGTAGLPELALEDGDRLYIPARPSTVGVFGSVFSAGSYLHNKGRTVGEYLRLAGGPTRRADEGSVFVVRANGTVSSSLADAGFFSRGNQIAVLATEPGDTIFVPDQIDRTTWTQDAKDWTQILYQFGLGIAGLKSALK